MPMQEEGGVYLFVSVDMVNSTEFKSRERNWPFVLHHFYESVVGEMKRVCPRFNVWKYIGDEVAFWRDTHREDNLAELIAGTNDALQAICAGLDSIESQKRYGIRTRHVVGAKATMWIASAHFVRDANIERDLEADYADDNRIIEEDHLVSFSDEGDGTVRKAYDFIGPDIDIGFRIAHFAQRGFLALSANLACLVLRQAKLADPICEHMKIIDYQALKGVWGGRRYPVIWYCRNWATVADKFYYDEEFDNPIVDAIRNGHRRIHDVGRIEKVLIEANRWPAIERACRLLDLPSEPIWPQPVW